MTREDVTSATPPTEPPEKRIDWRAVMSWIGRTALTLYRKYKRVTRIYRFLIVVVVLAFLAAMVVVSLIALAIFT